MLGLYVLVEGVMVRILVSVCYSSFFLLHLIDIAKTGVELILPKLIKILHIYYQYL